MDDSLDHGETRSAALWLCREKRIKDPGLDLGRHAYASVGDLQKHVSSFRQVRQDVKAEACCEIRYEVLISILPGSSPIALAALIIRFITIFRMCVARASTGGRPFPKCVSKVAYFEIGIFNCSIISWTNTETSNSSSLDLSLRVFIINS